jgi:hypothetical protein
VLLAAPQNDTPARVPGGGISLTCAFMCVLLGVSPLWEALEEMRAQSQRPRV